MILEDFQLLDNEVFDDNNIVKRDFIKLYHQQGAQLNDPDQNIKTIFDENDNYHQIGNAYLEYDITVRNPAAVFDNNSRVRLTTNGLAYFFKKLFWLLHRVQIWNIINCRTNIYYYESFD